MHRGCDRQTDGQTQPPRGHSTYRASITGLGKNSQNHDCHVQFKLSTYVIFEIFVFPVVHCPTLNTTFADVNMTDTEFGVTVNFTCLPGYKIDAQTTATIHCTNSGQWSLNASCLRT